MTVETTQAPAPTQPTGSVIEQLVGPDKKFKTVEAALQGKVEADAFVAKLTSEAAELKRLLQEAEVEKERLRARASIVDRLNQPNEPATAGTQNQQPVVTPQGPALSADDVVSLIRKTDMEKAAQANLQKVDAELVKTFGGEAVAFVRQKASELGFSTDELLNVGARSPDAFFNMIGVTRQGAGGNPMYAPSGTLNGKPVAVRNKAFYDNIKKEMGSTKFIMDKQIQIQLHKDMQALGDAFDN
jgi:hypothetical protein